MRNVDFTVPKDVVDLAQKLQSSGFQAYLVGGGIRDALLKREVKDWDLATSARPEEVQSLFPKVIPTGIQHGTVTVLTRGGYPVEVTTLRTEGAYRDGRRPEEVFYTDDLEKDLARRDFRMNAMAWDPLTQELHDPFAGEKDLQEKTIQTVGKALDRFREDGLRPIRAVRFAAQLEFDVSREILEAIPLSLDIVRMVAIERIREELMKIFQAKKPSVALELMRQTQLLSIVLPELLEGLDIEQNEYHAYDVYQHSLKACDESKGSPLLRFAVLLHDIAKPRSRRFLRGKYRFYGHDRLGARMTYEIMNRLRFSHADRDYVENLVKHHMFYYREDWNDTTVRRFMKRVGPENLEDLFQLRIADEIASGVNAPDYDRLQALRSRIEEENKREVALTVKQLAIDGNDVMEALHEKPGPKIGKIMNLLLEKVLEDPSLNEREHLLNLVKSELFSNV